MIESQFPVKPPKKENEEEENEEDIIELPEFTKTLSKKTFHDFIKGKNKHNKRHWRKASRDEGFGGYNCCLRATKVKGRREQS